jgi:hypothetical protein
MSCEYIVQRPDGMFLTFGGDWSGEYPDAKIFLSLQAARRAVDGLKLCESVGIYETDDYAIGNGPAVQS